MADSDWTDDPIVVESLASLAINPEESSVYETVTESVPFNISVATVALANYAFVVGPQLVLGALLQSNEPNTSLTPAPAVTITLEYQETVLSYGEFLAAAIVIPLGGWPQPYQYWG
jgi:hypothetical protein